MSIIKSLGKIGTTALTAVGKTTARAIITTPLIAGKLIAPESKFTSSLQKQYGTTTEALKDAGTTLSVASLIGGGSAVGGALKAGTKIITAKSIGYGLSGMVGTSLTAAPETTAKTITKLPSTIDVILEKAAENPKTTIAALSSVPVVLWGMSKAAGGITTYVASKTGAGKKEGKSMSERLGLDKTTNATPPYTPIPITPETPPLSNVLSGGQASSSGVSNLPIDNNVAAPMPQGQAGIPVLSSDKKRRARKKVINPIRISNRVEVRNVYKPQILVR